LKFRQSTGSRIEAGPATSYFSDVAGKKEKNMKYALGFAIAALAATGALAAHQKMSPDKMMPDQDMMDAKMEEHFAAVDANGDGKISEKELVAYVTKKAKADFAAMAGGDKFVTLDEMKAHHQAMHRKMMKDHAGMEQGGEDDGNGEHQHN